MALLVVVWLVPCEAAAVFAHILCTPYNHAPVYSLTSLERGFGKNEVEWFGEVKLELIKCGEEN